MSSPDNQLKFPCDCISSTPACEEPWAKVAKEGMFKDGAKENILNKLSNAPQTIAQLAKSAELAQPTVHRHINELVRHGLIKQTEIDSKNYVVERYYKLNFPVISKNDEQKYIEDINELSNEIAALMKKKIPDLKKKFFETEAISEGWKNLLSFYIIQYNGKQE